MPRAMTKAPNDMRCRSMPKTAISRKAATTVRISADPMTTPMRQPIGRVSTKRTITTAWSRLTARCWAAVSGITAGWAPA